jgi:digeranylgeranylglycerophospholipid reductase
MFDYDAIVIGAGPAGSTTARGIAQSGWRVALLERAAFGGQANVCGGGIEGDDAELIGVPPELIHKQLLRRDHFYPWGVTSFAKSHVTFLRREYDRYLSQQAVAAGVDLYVRVKAQDVELVAPGDLKVRMMDQNIHRQTSLRTRIVVFADGPHTLACKLFGFGFRRQPDTAAVGLIYELDWANCPLEYYEIHFGGQIVPWGYAWIFPKRDVLNVGIVCLPSKGQDSRRLEARLRQFVEGHSSLRGRKISRRAGAFIPTAPAARIYHTSMLAVGDAAGMVDSITGAGITNGVIAGGVAAEVIHQVLTQENYSAEFIRRYQQRWEATDHYKSLLIQHRFTRFFMPLSRFDRNIFAKLMQVLFMGDDLNRFQKLRLLAYPVLKPRRRLILGAGQATFLESSETEAD